MGPPPSPPRRRPTDLALAAVVLALALVAGSCGLVADDAAEPSESVTPSAGGQADGRGSAADRAGTEAADDLAPGTADEADMAEGGAALAGGPEVDPVPFDPEFADGPCPFTPPSGIEPRCGTVAVPADWATGDGTIELAVAVYPADTDAAAPDPVIYLDGGPGAHALETSRFNHGTLIAPLTARREVVVFDQRGAGLSRPSLDCPEVTDLTRELEDQPNLDDDAVEGRFADALSGCADRLAADGIELGHYNTVHNAHDVEAIRVALGYDRWNLYGISYGTRLGLEVLRRHPDSVRSAVLDSVVPPDVDRVRDTPAGFVASLDAVSDACDAEVACGAEGDLGDRLAALAQRYDADPVEVDVRDFLTAANDQVVMEGETIVGIVQQALYSPRSFGDLPELVAELEAGELRAAEAFLSQQRTNESFLTAGMLYAFTCNEDVPFAVPSEVAGALPIDPFGLNDRYDYASNVGSAAFDTCEAFGATPAPGSTRDPVVSDVPALVMAGRFDPVTPPAWAERVMAGLAAGHLVVDPHRSHAVSTSPCGMSMVTAFVDAPGQEPDRSCLDGDPVRFLVAPDPTVTFEDRVVATASGSEVGTVRPQEWTHGDLPGDSYRQDSILDPTQLIQVFDEPLLGLGLEFYLNELYDVSMDAGVEITGPDARPWTRRQGRSEVAVVEWYQTTISDVAAIVILVSQPDEAERNAEEILVPVLAAIDVS